MNALPHLSRRVPLGLSDLKLSVLTSLCRPSLSPYRDLYRRDSGEEERTLDAQLVRTVRVAAVVALMNRCIAANLPDESLPAMSEVTQTGVYYGFARVFPEKDGQRVLSEEESQVHPMVMSLGWNPFYKNEKLTAVRVFSASDTSPY